jgi:hypothetical protein
MQGYTQTIDNLVYYAINTLRSQNDEHWQLLDDIVCECAVTYNVPLEDVYDDYKIKLRKQLLTLIYDV